MIALLQSLRRSVPARMVFGSTELSFVKQLQQAEDKFAPLVHLTLYIASDEFSWMRVGVRDYVSNGGCFTCCDDIYGYEIKMRSRLMDADQGMIDCSPSHYGLTMDQGQLLFGVLAERFDAYKSRLRANY